MKDVYIFHYAVNCLYLEWEKAIFLEDSVRVFDETSRRLFNDFYVNFWLRRMNIQEPLLISTSNQNIVSNQLKGEGGNTLKPFSLPSDYQTIAMLLEMFNARLYGSDENPRKIFDTILSFKSKVKTYELCRQVNPQFLGDGLENVSASGLESAVRRLLRNGHVVVKGEYGQMGMHSKIITNKDDVEQFLERCKSSSFVASQEVKKPGLFIVEPFFEHSLAPSACFYITDDSILLKYRHDRKVDGLEYVESTSPSESPNIDRIIEFSLDYARILQGNGYRGPVDFEFMEDSNGILKFCEINARYPISYYPSEFPIGGKPYRLKKFRLKRPELSFELLNKVLGDYWYNPDTKRGIIPLNIPYFLEPQQRFALLFVGDDKTQIEEMHRAANVLAK